MIRDVLHLIVESHLVWIATEKFESQFRHQPRLIQSRDEACASINERRANARSRFSDRGTLSFVQSAQASFFGAIPVPALDQIHSAPAICTSVPRIELLLILKSRRRFSRSARPRLLSARPLPILCNQKRWRIVRQIHRRSLSPFQD